MNGTYDRITVMSHLTETGQDAASDLDKVVRDSGVLRSARGLGAVGPLVTGPVVGAVAETLQFGLGDVIVWAWQKHQAIKEAAVATLSGDGEARYVGLADHKIKSEHQPKVDVMIDEQSTVTLEFDLTLEFKIEALLLTIQRGLLVGLSPARCDLEATFGAHGLNVSRSGKYRIPDLVQVRTGLPLLHRSYYTQNAESVYRPPAV
jgi:hypothetical protein